MTKRAYYSVLGALSAVGAFAANLLGGWDTALQTLLAVIAADYATGLLCALVWKKSPKSGDGCFESNASFKGLLRKMGILLCVLVAVRIDLHTGTELARDAVIIFFIANDGLSIVENLGIMGVPIPPAIAQAFSVLRQRAKQEREVK